MFNKNVRYFYIISLFIVSNLGYGLSLVHANNTVSEQSKLILNLADLIESEYVIKNVAINVAYKLRNDVALNRYSQYYKNPIELSEVLTKNIKKYSNDKHFYVEFVKNKSNEDNWIDEWLNDASSTNFGIKKIELLNNEIGYLALSTFYPLELAEPAFINAMHLLQNTQGMILDLRFNGGGDNSLVNALLHTFLPNDVELPLKIESRHSIEPKKSAPKLKWEPYSENKKLIVLVNNRTFSAPEAFAFSLQETGRAVIIGTQSAGGAHMTDKAIKLSGGYEAGIPNKRPVSIKTGKNWESTGVIPNIIATDDEAIKVALEQLKM